MSQQGGEELTRSLARSLGAARAWVLPVSVHEALVALGSLLPGIAVVEPLGGSPVACCDIKEQGTRAHEEGSFLVADVSLMGPAGCAAVRLGAQVALAVGDGAWCIVGVGKTLLQKHPALPAWLDATAGHPLPVGCDVAACLDARTRLWHATSDAAQVVAAYLRCHPRVMAVRYPGLKSDPSFAVAARTLTGGFGPLVDYQLVGEGEWQRLTCTDEDPRAQVMRLEAALMSIGDSPQRTNGSYRL